MSHQPLSYYAAQVAESSKALEKFCNENNHPQPQIDGVETILPKNATPEILDTRQNLVDAALRILQTVSEPAQFIPYLSVQAQQISALRWLCRFNVVALVPPTGSISYQDLAVATKTPVKQLKSIVRMMMCAGFFTETPTKDVKHTRLSVQFAQSDPLQTWATFLAEDTVPMALKLYEATSEWGDTVSKTETAFNVAFDRNKSFFEWLSSSPEGSKKFAGYMKAVTATQGTAIQHLLTGYDWAQFEKCKLVDIGGSTGHASIALAEKHCGMKFVVQDLPRVIEGVDTNSLDKSIASRIQFDSYDFFQPQPVTDGDVYLLRQILHDWPDVDATKILKQIVAVMKPDTRLIIMDTALPVPGTISVSQESQLRVRDMTMMQTFNALERDVDDWRRLLKSTDARLELKSVNVPAGSNLAVMEVRLE